MPMTNEEMRLEEERIKTGYYQDKRLTECTDEELRFGQYQD